ncbi:MAG: YlxR family protein [Firmicutes bacterium]|nr:YlxR family protein [Bacillota bacterium]
MLKQRKVPLRKCTGCQEMKSKKEMIRVVRDPQGNVSIDRTGKKSGRGAYICDQETCLEKVIACKGIERSLSVSVGAELVEALRKEFRDGE